MVSSASNKPVQAADVAAVVQQQWSAHMAGRCVLEVGLSGGLDSVVLLHVLWRLQAQLPIQVRALHVHHGLQAAADEWLAFCVRLCRQWQIPLRCERVQVAANSGLGPEGAARQVRYAAFERSTAQAVVLAHHADDQVETLLLAALRGGGIRALAGMPAQRKLAEGLLLWRPLLGFDRAQLAAYAAAWDLSWVDDPSNGDTGLLRNWLRHHGLPALQARVPDVMAKMRGGMVLLQDELAVLEEVCAADWQMLHRGGGGFDVAVWRTLSPARQRQQLRHFACRHGLGAPRRAGVAAFAYTLRQPGLRTAQWPLPHGGAVLHAGVLWPQQSSPQQQWPWLAALPLDNDRIAAVQLPLRWQPHVLGLPEHRRNGVWRILRADDVLPWQNGRKNVKKILRERQIPPFMRSIWPVLVADQHSRQCLAVANVAVAVDQGVPGGGLPVVSDLPLRA